MVLGNILKGVAGWSSDALTVDQNICDGVSGCRLDVEGLGSASRNRAALCDGSARSVYRRSDCEAVSIRIFC